MNRMSTNLAPKFTRLRLTAAWLFVLLLSSCDDGRPLPGYPDIPRDKKLVDLTADEAAKLCEWGKEVGARVAPASGTVFECNGRRFKFFLVTDCMFNSNLPPECDATVANVLDCTPALYQEVSSDLCAYASVRTPEEVNTFLKRIPECAGFSGCAYPQTP